MAQREAKSLSDSEVSDIVKSVKSKLKPEDLIKLSDSIERQIKKHMRLTGQASTSLSWRLTQRLQVTCGFLASKFKTAAGESVVKKDRRDRHESSYGRPSKHHYSRDAPFMRKAARLPKCTVRVKRLHLKPGRRYNAAKFMRNLPPSKVSQKSASERERDRERSGEKKRKRIIDSSSSSSSPSSSDEGEITNGASTSKKEEKMKVDSDEESVPNKKPKVELEEKPEKPKSSNTSSSLFDQMMKRETERKSTDAPSKRSSTDSRESSPKPKVEKVDLKPVKRESEKKSTESRESSPKPKAEKEESKPKPLVTDLASKPAIKDLAAKPEKEKHRSSSSSTTKDDKKSKTFKDGEIQSSFLSIELHSRIRKSYWRKLNLTNVHNLLLLCLKETDLKMSNCSFR